MQWQLGGVGAYPGGGFGRGVSLQPGAAPGSARGARPDGASSSVRPQKSGVASLCQTFPASNGRISFADFVTRAQDFGFYAKEAEECFRCVAGASVDGKALCPEAVEAGALARFIRQDALADAALDRADGLVPAVADLAKAPLPTTLEERRSSVHARRLVLARLDALLQQARSLCAEAQEELRDRALEARVSTAREEARAAAAALIGNGGAAGAFRQSSVQSSFTQPLAPAHLSAVNVTAVPPSPSPSGVVEDGVVILAEPADSDLGGGADSEHPPESAREVSPLPEEHGFQEELTPELQRRFAPVAEDSELVPRDADPQGQVRVMWQLLLQKYAHVQQMETQAQRARKQLSALSVSQQAIPREMREMPLPAKAEKRRPAGASPAAAAREANRDPRRAKQHHDAEKAFLEATEHELQVLQEEIKSTEQWLVQHGVPPAGPVVEERKPRAIRRPEESKAKRPAARADPKPARPSNAGRANDSRVQTRALATRPKPRERTPSPTGVRMKPPPLALDDAVPAQRASPRTSPLREDRALAVPFQTDMRQSIAAAVSQQIGGVVPDPSQSPPAQWKFGGGRMPTRAPPLSAGAVGRPGLRAPLAPPLNGLGLPW